MGDGGFAVVALALAVAMLSTTLPTPLYVLYRERFGFSELMITVIFATYTAGVICALLLLGGLSDEIGRRPMLGLGLAFSALSAVAFLLANGLGLLLVGRVLSGLSAGIFTGTATATLVDLAPHGAARATLVATIANIGGLGCGPLLAGILAQSVTLPLRTPFWVDLALLVPAAVAVAAMPEPITKSGSPRLRPQRLSVPRKVRPIFIQAAVAGFAGFAVLGLCTAVAPAFLGHTLGVKSAMSTCRYLAPRLIAKGSGSIIVMGSGVGKAGTPALYADYAAEKGAVMTYVLAIAHELKPYGVAANILLPGHTRNHRYPHTIDDPTLADPEDCVPAAVFLASDDSAWITGESLYIAGGYR